MCYVADELFPERNLCHFVNVVAPAWKTIDILSKSCNLRGIWLTFRQKRDGAVKPPGPVNQVVVTGLTPQTQLVKPNLTML